MRLQFLFDFISPYAWLAWRALSRIEAQTGVTAEPVPILFAALLNHHGQLGPAEIPAKRLYVFKDALRRARAAGYPLVPPPAHPFNPLGSLRLATVDQPAAIRTELIDRLFGVAWGGERPARPQQGLDDDEVLRAVASGVVGPSNAEALLASSREPAVKDALRARTEAAIAAGAFGVPTFVATGADGRTELFWGFESIDLLVRFLTSGDLIDEGDTEPWRSLPATADRRGGA